MRVLLVDATLNFLRNYTVVPQLDRNGSRIGGVYGMLTSLSFWMKKINPDRIILAWDGVGGSKKRRKILKEYKAGRKPTKPKINKNFEFEEEDLEQNKAKQRLRLEEYLEDLPITEVNIDEIEADDVIAYCVNYFKDDQKVVVSNDMDFCQLLDEKTIIFQPTKKQIYTKASLVNEHHIYPHNFVLARAIVGDKSDNISGVRGVGLSRLLKYFPFISSEDQVTMQDIQQFSLEKLNQKDKKYQKFIDSKEKIEKNFQIMQLKTPIISFTNMDLIKSSLENPISYNATGFRSKLFADGITNVGSTFFHQFKLLNIRSRRILNGNNRN